MNRRSFLGALIGGITAGAAVRAWPFRVFSFPGGIRIPDFVWHDFDPRRVDVMDLSEWGRLRFSPYTGILYVDVAMHHSGDPGRWMGLDRSTYPARFEITAQKIARDA